MELSEAEALATPLPVRRGGTPGEPSESTWAPPSGSMPSAPSPASSELAQLLDRIRQLTPQLSDAERLAASRELAEISASFEAEANNSASASPPRPQQISFGTCAEDDGASSRDELAVDEDELAALAQSAPAGDTSLLLDTASRLGPHAASADFLRHLRRRRRCQLSRRAGCG